MTILGGKNHRKKTAAFQGYWLYIVIDCFRYKEGRFPEHMETLTVKNTSPLDADISFCYLHDSKGETFLLDPPTMMLKPGDQQV